MSTNERHDKILNTIYHDEAGYGSITSTFKEAFQTCKAITFNYVKQWFQSNLETTEQVKGSNSFGALSIL
jgi:DNA replication protein DnaD